MHPLTSCLPYYLAADLLQHPDYDPVARPQRFEVVVLFADISGFTPMSESLARTGKKGTEELTNLLNQYFGAMIELIRAYGGTIAKFGGDALTVLFPCVGPATSRLEAARRTLTCALAMQQQMTAYQSIITSAGTFALAMKAGLSIGQVFSASVGHSNYRLEYIVAGSVLERAALAEHHAHSGDTICHRGLLPFLGEIESSPVNNDFVKVSRIFQATRPLAPPVLPATLPPALLPIFAAYLHPTIAHLLVTEGQTDFINEHRKVSVLFIGFDGFDYDHDAHVSTKLQNYLLQVLEIIRNYDGHLRQVEMGDKGSKYIVLFGAPIAHEDDEVRALHCALDLRQAAQTLAISTRTGLNTGQAFCGLVGSDLRREYAAIGDGVNLSARLMQAAAPDQILLSEATRQAVPAAAFIWQTLEPIIVKGKTAPVSIFGLVGVNQVRAIRLQEPQYALPMVGRTDELAIAAAKLEILLVAQQGQLLGVVGEAGIGKSRLVAEIIQLANARWLIGYGGECQSYGTNSNYLVWQPIFRAFFGINQAWEVADQISLLETQLTLIDPALLPRLPLLAAIFNLPIPDNDLTRALEGQLRKTSLEALLIDCLKARATATPLLLVLEDCHWLDPLSHDLLESLGRTIANSAILILLAYRPPELERLKTVRVTQLPYYTEMRLKDFNPDETERLIGLKLGQFFGPEATSLPEALANQLKLRAAGNPFYIEELLNYLQSKGLDLHQPQNLEHLDLPGSLESLIISRIDQLTEEEKITLKVASVIGRLFKANWLWQVYPQLGEPEKVKQQLENLSHQELTPLDKSEPELEYLFKHIIMQEVAYESLALATRTVLHGQIAAYIEQIYANRLEQYLDLLAYHYGRSNNVSKQRDYFQRAGDAAQAVFANSVALDYYQKLLELLPKNEQLDTLLKMAQIFELTGQWVEAEARAKQALTLAEQLQDRARQINSKKIIGLVCQRQGNNKVALEWLEQARLTAQQFVAETPKDDSAQIMLAEVMIEIGKVYWTQGDYEAAQLKLVDCLALGRKLNNNPIVAASSNVLANVAHYQGDYATAHAIFEETLRVRQDMNDTRGIASALNNLGNVALLRGNPDKAQIYYQESLPLRRMIGDKPGVALTLENYGLAAAQQGRYDEAESLLKEGLSVLRELGAKRSIALSLSNYAEVTSLQGNYSAAQILYQESLDLSRQLGDKHSLVLALNGSGMASYFQANYAQAKTLFQEALAIARDLKDKHQIVESLNGLAGILATQQPIKVELLAKAVQLCGTITATLKAMGEVQLELFSGKINATTLEIGQRFLNAQDFATAFAAGQMLDLEQAISLALHMP